MDNFFVEKNMKQNNPRHWYYECFIINNSGTGLKRDGELNIGRKRGLALGHMELMASYSKSAA